MSVPPLNPFAGMAAIGPNDRKSIQHEREQDKSQTKIEQKAIGDSEADRVGVGYGSRRGRSPKLARRRRSATAVPRRGTRPSGDNPSA
jgi:hypothetical protein